MRVGTVDETQLKAVLNHMRTRGKITSWEAIELYGATRLPAIVWVLIHKRGIDVKSRWVTGTNRFGNHSRWKEFYLEDN